MGTDAGKPAIEGVLETCIYVDDLEAAHNFYGHVLGLHFLCRQKERHVFFRCGSQMLLIFDPNETCDPESDTPTHGSHGPVHIALAVRPEDIQAWRRRLGEHGVPIEKEVQWPQGGESLYFRDPAGNSLELATPSIWHGVGDAEG